ncbi:MAG TPA: NapC/NirT family cytochrome c [Candidatus Aquicultor sp.]|jgi:nitrate/TMAO reductase-like tetraheme cytochrome c subunit
MKPINVAKVVERIKNNKKLALSLTVAAAVVILLLAGGVVATSKPAFCNRCHEMQPSYNSWMTSNHATVDCGSCHADFSFSVTSVAGTELHILRDMFLHSKNDYVAPINKGSVLSKASSFESCSVCHSSKRLISARITTAHKTHSEKLHITCVYCHNRVGHPNNKEYDDRSKMKSCIACHQKKRASVGCKTCHPKTPPGS